MSLRAERERAERRGSRLYEALLGLGAAVLAAGLLGGLGLALYGTAYSPRPKQAPPPAGLSSDLRPEPPGRPLP